MYKSATILYILLLCFGCCDSSTPPNPYAFTIFVKGKNTVNKNKQTIKIMSFDDKKEVAFNINRTFDGKDSLSAIDLGPNKSKYIVLNSELNRIDTLTFEGGFKSCQLITSGAAVNDKSGKQFGSGTIVFEVQ